MTAEQLQELASGFAVEIDQRMQHDGERCAVIVVLTGQQPGSPLAVGSNVMPSYRAGLVANLKAAARAVAGE
jgi:hypothetical protein